MTSPFHTNNTDMHAGRYLLLLAQLVLLGTKVAFLK